MTDAHVLQTQAIHEPAVQPRRSIRGVLQRDVTQRDVPDRRVRQAVYPRRRGHLRDVDTLESEAVDDAPADVHRRQVQQTGHPIPPDVVHVHVLDDAARRLGVRRTHQLHAEQRAGVLQPAVRYLDVLEDAVRPGSDLERRVGRVADAHAPYRDVARHESAFGTSCKLVAVAVVLQTDRIVPAARYRDVLDEHVLAATRVQPVGEAVQDLHAGNRDVPAAPEGDRPSRRVDDADPLDAKAPAVLE